MLPSPRLPSATYRNAVQAQRVYYTAVGPLRCGMTQGVLEDYLAKESLGSGILDEGLISLCVRISQS